jgi:hypothetical protein
VAAKDEVSGFAPRKQSVEPLGITIGIMIAGVLIASAAFFAWRQTVILRTLGADVEVPPDQRQRRYLLKQCSRRLFGSLLLFVLAGMMIGALFLDFDPDPQVDRAAAKQTVQFLSFYVMAMLLVLLVILILAIVDFWAIARFSLQQRKQLLLEQQQMLEADLWEHQHRISEPET